ncbi:hypothetical protein JYU29_03800 [Tianweitania sp. BSSL-BM11]|uniref:Uncharacterized protein n=1 Tax=Tianweitania aestuarii TaxID=2814886 RepID=A0ABS5RS52_9HYPH|nr:hypothetical protein [Tianweitania aestuarii]MBS9719809.1 hypothetical protein [Tianweitania aestuarii]
MQAQQVLQDDFDFSDALETIELELALQVQDVSKLGFDAAVDVALTSLGGQLLFRLPATPGENVVAVAAVSMPTGEDGGRKLLLVKLGEDGETMQVEDAASGNNPVADLACSMAGLLDTFDVSTAREEEPILL